MEWKFAYAKAFNGVVHELNLMVDGEESRCRVDVGPAQRAINGNTIQVYVHVYAADPLIGNTINVRAVEDAACNWVAAQEGDQSGTDYSTSTNTQSTF
jgi:hypothetical protein